MATYKQVGYGSQGSDVKKLQQVLNSNGYKLDVDGIFGSKTQAAVKDYQKKNKLAVDGIVGNNTWGALTKASTTQKPASTPASTEKKDSFQYKGYQESDAVKQAQALLNQQLSQKPGAYQSQWQSQLNDIINKIQNREKFSYDLNGDALYQQYKDQYVLQGQQAMMDTMGQAAALTGGYGNSYAQTAGQQAYQSHLQGLNDIVPELYQMALSKYQMEGDQLTDQYAMLAQQEDLDYGRYRDQMGDWQTERDYLAGRYDTERDYDYGKWADGRDFSYGQFIDERNYQYQQDRDKVADEQWQKEFDEAKRQYDQAYALKNSASSSDSSSSDDSDSSDDEPASRDLSDTEKIKLVQKYLGVTQDGVWGPESRKAAGGLDFDKAWSNFVVETDYGVDKTPAPSPTPSPLESEDTDGFNGTTYSEAVAYMKSHGVPNSNAAFILTKSEWARAKSSGSSRYGANEFDSYSEYLQYAVDANIEAYGKK